MEQQVADWRKSRASANGEACVEVGTASGAVAVRDTTDRGGAMLWVSGAAWAAFLGTLR
jgi:hypothetical protein